MPTPVSNETLAESDAFWDHWADFPHPRPIFDAASLAENVSQAHLVIRGHITDVYVGEYWQVQAGTPSAPIFYVTVAIGEVLRGTPVSRTPGVVEVGLGTVSPDMLDELRASLPQHDNVWFLMHTATHRPRTPANMTEIAPFAYIPSNDLQGVLRNIGGAVKLIKPQWTEQTLGENHFPLPLQGTSFDLLVELVREIGQTMPEVTTLPSL